MKKIPTIFLRARDEGNLRDDYAANLVIDKINPTCAWVFEGEGVATIKLDGTCMLVRDGKRYKRREFKPDAVLPIDFEMTEIDFNTGKFFGWMPVGDGPEDKYHREAIGGLWNDTYELIGPKVQGHREAAIYQTLIERGVAVPERHVLVQHGAILPAETPPRTFESLREWLTGQDIEGLVWHHRDGRKAKIKLRDYGLKRPELDTLRLAG